MKSKILILFLAAISLSFAAFAIPPGKNRVLTKAEALKLIRSAALRAKKNNNVVVKSDPTGKCPVYGDMNGNFYTYFGWGFGFGDFFPHPTTGDPANNGQPYVTTAYGSVDYFDQNLNEYDEYDGYFTVSYLIDPDYPYGEGGIITFTGYFVYDSSSPTDVSIMPGLPPVD